MSYGSGTCAEVIMKPITTVNLYLAAFLLARRLTDKSVTCKSVTWILHVRAAQAMAQWGAPEAVVSDHGAVFVALQPCLAPLAIQWAPITKSHPWQNLAGVSADLLHGFGRFKALGRMA
jgi:hypothetical protein